MTNINNENLEHTNTNITYEYAKWVFEGVNKSIDISNQKMTTIIGFCGILLRFANDLQDNNIIFYAIKILVVLFLLLAITISLWGLLPQEGGGIVPPKELRDSGEYYFAKDEKSKQYITDNLLNATQQLVALRDNKTKKVTWSIIFLGLATIFFAIGIILPKGCYSKQSPM